MEDSIEVKPTDSFWWFRWVFFFAGVLFTIVWIFGNVKGEDGLAISDATRMFCVSIFFPCFWLVGFLPHIENELVIVNRTGVAVISASLRSIFHRRTREYIFVPAEDVLNIEFRPDSESNDVDVFIAHKGPSVRSSCIKVSRFPDDAHAWECSTKAARLLNCEVVHLAKPLTELGSVRDGCGTAK